MAAMRESSLYNQGRCFATCSVFFLLNLRAPHLRAAKVVGLFSYELLSGTRLILVCGVFFFVFFNRILTVKRISWLLMVFCSSGASEAEAT